MRESSSTRATSQACRFPRSSRSSRSEEEAYYALRNSFIPLWSVYIPDDRRFVGDDFDLDIPHLCNLIPHLCNPNPSPV